jgi:hypothetical protein
MNAISVIGSILVLAGIGQVFYQMYRTPPDNAPIAKWFGSAQIQIRTLPAEGRRLHHQATEECPGDVNC